MKKFLPFIVLLAFTLACSSQRKVSDSNTTPRNTTQVKKVHVDQQIAPGTCSLSIKDCKLISEKNTFWLTGKVASVSAYGAGFTEVLERDQIIKIKIDEKQYKSIDQSKLLQCTITSVTRMNKPVLFELVEHKQ